MRQKQHRGHPRSRWIVKILVGILFLVGIWNVWKPLPQEINKAWGYRSLSPSQVTLLTDTTYIDAQGKRVSDQQIFDEVFSMIANAKSYIFVDMFLWNDFGADPTKVHRALSSELADALIAKKQQNPNMVIQVVSDPINTVYSGQPNELFSRMKDAGILVTYTNLTSLRDSNPILSSMWRVFIYPFDYLHTRIFGVPYTVRFVPNILDTDGEPVTIRAYLSLLNFKANHRKLIVVDKEKNGKINFDSLVTSANPHDGSSSHSNVAFKVEGAITYDILQSEKRVVEMAGNSFVSPPVVDIKEEGALQARLVTDKAILDEAVSMIQKTRTGDTITMLMFYFSEGSIVNELLAAASRGVSVRLILDPNKDAFGKQKNGIPNRQIADMLVSKSGGTIGVKWCDTHGEQCHGKMLIVKSEGMYKVLLGSANFTRRNIGGYNLESNIVVQGTSSFQAWKEASNYFNVLWDNSQGVFSTEFETYKDSSSFKKVLAWIMEHSGLGTF